MRNFGLHRHARVERRRTINPEVPPDAVWGDVGVFVPPLIERGMPSWRWRMVKIAIGIIGWFGLVVTLFALAMWMLGAVGWARDDGRYSNSPLKPWFDQLASKKGLCCSFTDGVKVENVDWDTRTSCPLDDEKNMEAGCTIHYRVRLDGRWIVVPEASLITEPNRYGAAVVWPYHDTDGVTQIRCFIPGAGA